jgi:digalactosyldiacylglycerol synthase
MVRAYCDKVIHLSATLPKYAPEKEVVSNVHGVRNEFFRQRYTPSSSSTPTTQMYFLGKLLWAKGLDKILELQEVFKSMTGRYFEMDIYGSGPDEEEIRQAFARSTISTTSYSDFASAAYWIGDKRPHLNDQQRKMDAEPLPVQFKGRVDHAALDASRDGCYKIFVNPSVSEVLCTVTAEALAMGKFVVIPRHASNTFFEQFPNCLLYESQAEFCAQLQYALSHQPTILPDRSALTWEAATDRLIRAASISHREAVRLDRLFATRDQRLADWHIKMYVLYRPVRLLT